LKDAWTVTVFSEESEDADIEYFLMFQEQKDAERMSLALKDVGYYSNVEPHNLLSSEDADKMIANIREW
jgi:hypothetical protein